MCCQSGVNFCVKILVECHQKCYRSCQTKSNFLGYKFDKHVNFLQLNKFCDQNLTGNNFFIITSPPGNFQTNPRNTHRRFGRESSATLNASNRSLLCFRILSCKPYCLSTVKVCKRRFHYRGSLLNLVLACLSTMKICKRRFNHRSPSAEGLAGLFKYRECLNTSFYPPLRSSEALASLFKYHEDL